ncbi:hypothetical protein TSAR_008502 [Trichomalopsis sarcophagae]|uniref:Uncharacterized protein n=1 Tax=Trichomalopsis sarcophagae TaxID=543379 RepID=A0A232EXW4_9HYME|nr:hypothetical protein TSAR_008502 [Trichomalopsis sarcophagae]
MYDDHITPVYKKYGILSYQGRLRYISLSFQARVLRTGTPSYLGEMYVFRDVDKPGSRRANVHDLVIAHASFECYIHLFRIGTS